MRIAFAIFKFFPHGGISRDLAKIARCCLERGHGVRIYAMAWRGAPLPGVDVVLLPTRGLRSHVRQRRFARRLAARLAEQPADLVVGMNKMPGLDAYYAGDSCFEDKARAQRPWAYRLTPRYRHFAAFEQAVFAPAAGVRILAISPMHSARYRAIYGTPEHRFRQLPPGIERDRAAAQADRQRLRAAVRGELGIGDDAHLLLFIGSGFVKKGLDRALRALAALPAEAARDVHLAVAGEDRERRFRRLARRLRIAQRVHFLGGRDDVPALLQAADAGVLPAYDENAGMVILEGAVAGLPMLVTANCGYAPYIARADAGLVTPVPFEQRRFDADFARLLHRDERAVWARNARALAADESLYAMAPAAAAELERIAAGAEPPLAAFCAYAFHPADAATRALLPVAAECRARGVSVRIYARDWHGAAPPGMELVRVPVAGTTHAARVRRWRQWVAADARRVGVRCVVACGPLRQADVDLARAAGAADMPPGLAAQPPTPRAARRAEEREAREEGCAAADRPIVFALAGGDLVAAGFERLIAALGRLPAELRGRCRVLAIGRLPARFRGLARALGMRAQVRVLAPDDAEALRAALGGADVFVDLAYRPGPQSWTFDALGCGCAALVHARIAGAELVRRAEAGIVLDAPFRQADCSRAAATLAGDAAMRARWRRNARRCAADPCRYGAAERLAQSIAARCRPERAEGAEGAENEGTPPRALSA